MKQLFLLICLSTTIFANYLNLNDQQIENIIKKPNKEAIFLRFKKYYQLRKQVKEFNTLKKLNYINTFFNKILPVEDKFKYQTDDYWATPKEFLIEGRGDCEEYAISKYFSLKEIGIDEDKLFLAIVKVKGKTNYHLVLLYFENRSSIPLVLDNLSFKVLPFDKRSSLTTKVIFNEKEAFVLKDKKIYKKAKIDWGDDNKWEKILNKINTGK